MAVPIDGTGTASMAPLMAPPVLGVQKPPRQVGKRFRDRLVAEPEGKVKKPAGLKTRPAWLRQDRLGVNPAVCRGDAGCQVCECGCEYTTVQCTMQRVQPDRGHHCGSKRDNKRYDSTGLLTVT